jgi:hypothetical protein
LDIDKDGLLRLEGFKAGILSPEYGLKVDEVLEIFSLVSRDGLFQYRDYLIEINPNLRGLLARGSSTTPS